MDLNIEGRSTNNGTVSARIATTSPADSHSGLTSRDGVALADGDVVLDNGASDPVGLGSNASLNLLNFGF